MFVGQLQEKSVTTEQFQIKWSVHKLLKNLQKIYFQSKNLYSDDPMSIKPSIPVRKTSDFLPLNLSSVVKVQPSKPSTEIAVQ